MQSLQKAFQLETDSHTITTIYQPSHIDFRVIDKRTNNVQEGLFYDSTLPANVKEECEAVADLFDYLESKTSSEMQVEGNSLRFKVVRIKKERWYSLDIHDQPEIVHSQEARMEERMDEKIEERVEKMEEEEGENPLRVLTEQRDELAQQNEALRQQVERLSAANQELQKKLQSNDLQLLIENGLMEFSQEGVEAQPLEDDEESHKAAGNMPVKQQESLHQEQNLVKKLILTNPALKNSRYKIEKNVVTKISDQPSILSFQDCIKRGERVYFSVQLLTNFENNWFILGVVGKEHQQKPYCYLSKGCIAYSGALSNVFNELDTIDLQAKPSRGDCLRMQLNARPAAVEWFINGELVCSHKMGGQICEKDLYPYLMLAHSGDSLRINCEE